MMNKKTNDADVCGLCSLRFPVTNLKKSVDFYCNVLGYEIANPNETEFPHGEVYLVTKNGNGPGVFLMETSPEDFVPLKFVFPRSSWITNKTQHVMVVEMLTNDLNALYVRLKQAGARIEKEPVFNSNFYLL